MISQQLATRLGRVALAAALVAPAALLSTPEAHAAVSFGISISVGTPPPPLPVYVQPPLPAPGYLWTPGYWAWGDAGYYWVPGTWVEPPQVGLLWTPGYWGFADNVYGWHPGYWGPHVGFYGGVNYGFGYGGVGFFGGEWRGGGFFYNSAVANFGGVHVTNVYENRTVIVNNTIINNNHVAYNGGPNGIRREPTIAEQEFARGQHFQPTANQMQHQQFAAQDRGQLAAVNGGRPQTFAVRNPAAYHQVAQQHMQAEPIRPQDRQMGRNFNTAAFQNRQANQDQRIANGLRSGQMTSGEAAQANRAEAGINQQIRTDRQANGGAPLTYQQRQGINQQQNAAGRQIYNDNHNGNTIRPNFVDNREANQDGRMANGMRNGQVTNGEALRMQNRQGNVDQQVHNDRVANGGRMNGPERQQVQREQNRASQQVHADNHNDRRH